MAKRRKKQTRQPASERLFPDWPPPEGPFGLSSVVGHQRAVRLLRDQVEGAGLPHALLVSGPRGVGKRTLAMSLAAQQFCARGSGCGCCDPCGALRRSNWPSLRVVTNLEGKNVISIDQVKELRQELTLWPPTAKGRVCLLLDADRMTFHAQDALLKTLEEPPAGNVLVLTTDRVDGVLATIRSRCQRITLSPLTDAEVSEVARRQGWEYDVPVSAAMGCPGELALLADPDVPVLRQGLARLLAEPRATADHARIVALLYRGLPKKTPLARVRERARLLLTLMGSQLRDAVVLAAGAEEGEVPYTLRNPDLADLLGGGDSPAGPAALHRQPAEVVRRLARAAGQIATNVDPAAAVYGVLDPASDELAPTAEWYGT